MKKLILAAVIAFSTIAFSACTKENVQPQHKTTTLSDKADLGQADGDKADLGQADGDKADLGQADGGGQ